jgi:RNA polymerase sigma factor (sigma-70 family)
VALDDAVVVAPGESADADLVALDEALIALGRIDPRKAHIVEMRFFGGLSVEEIAEVLKVSTGTIKRDWRAAKAWLYQEMTR